MGLIQLETFTPEEHRLIEPGLLNLSAALVVGSESSAAMLKGLDAFRDSDGWDPAWHEYLRVSVDKSGVKESQRQQHDDNELHRDRNKGRKGATYQDTGSASVYARKARDDFDQLMKDLQAGAVFAPGDILQLWESSRGSREQEEWARFLNLLRDRRVLVYVTSHGRLYDLHNPRDRRSLDEDGVDSAYESAKTSLRIRRDTRTHAVNGRPHGRCPVGYTRTRHPDTGRVLKQLPHPDTGRLITELFRRLKLRQTFRRIEKNWRARGIVNASGRPYSGAHLRALATNPVYAGLRVYDPGRQGRKLSAVAMITKGNWEPLVDLKTFFIVQRFLNEDGRRTSDRRGNRPGRAVHWLSMIAKCDVCGSVLSVRARREGGKQTPPEYTCHKGGHVRIDMAEVDAFAEQAILAYLAREDVYERLRAVEDDTNTELARVHAELAVARAEHDELSRRVAAGSLSIAFAAKAEPGLLARIAKLEQQEQELVTPLVLGGLITPGKDVARRWRKCELSTRRQIAKIVLSPELLGELRVLRSPVRGHRVPVEQRVRLIVAQDAAAA